MVKGPLLLEIGCLPQVASATSSTMIFFTSSATVIQVTPAVTFCLSVASHPAFYDSISSWEVLIGHKHYSMARLDFSLASWGNSASHSWSENTGRLPLWFSCSPAWLVRVVCAWAFLVCTIFIGMGLVASNHYVIPNKFHKILSIDTSNDVFVKETLCPNLTRNLSQYGRVTCLVADPRMMTYHLVIEDLARRVKYSLEWYNSEV